MEGLDSWIGLQTVHLRVSEHRRQRDRSEPPTERPPVPAPPDRLPPQRYLPGLDGMRALAVIAVVIFHSSLGILPGGFLGVEVFFVISGYIITRALLAERRTRGRIDLRGFWMRRARRLLPALFLLLLAAAGYSVLFEGTQVADLRHDIVAALVYVTNWDLIATGETYFDSFERPSLLRHLWSLAVEEQFYLIWPLVIGGGLAVMGRGSLLTLIVAGIAASAIAMALLYEPGGDVTRIYYGTDTRASGLLIGAALAFLWNANPQAASAGIVRRSAIGLLGLAGLAGVAAFLVFVDGGTPFLYQGGFALVGLATAALIVAATSERSILASALGTPLLRWFGVRSYGIYLWHWPVMMLTRPGVDVPFDGLPLFAMQVAITLWLSEASYRWVEVPVRTGALGRLRRRLDGWTAAPRWQRGALTLASASSAAGIGAIVALVVLAQPQQDPPYFELGNVRLVSPAQASAAPSTDVASRAIFGDDSANPYAVWLPGIAAPGSESAPLVLAQREETAALLAVAVDAARFDRAAASAAETVLVPLTNPGVRPPANQTTTAASAAAAAGGAAAPAARGEAEPATTAGGPIRITAVGDSVMLGAAYQLASDIAGIDLDAAVGRQVSEAIAVLRQRKASGQLGDIVLLHIGNNGTFTDAQFDEIVEIAGAGRRIIFLNLKVPRAWEEPNNAVITNGVARHGQAVMVDWRTAIAEHPEVLWTDDTHLRPEGALYYVQIVAAHVGS